MEKGKVIITALISITIAFLLASWAGFVPAGDTDVSPRDRVAIERALFAYADTLDAEDCIEGHDLFVSLFTDDCVVAYPAFGVYFEGTGDNPPIFDSAGKLVEPGGIGYMYSNWICPAQSQSVTKISNIIIDIHGREAMTKNNFVHIGYGADVVDPTYDDAEFTWGYHTGEWRKVHNQWLISHWVGTVKFDNSGAS